ncbi:MAG TPA: hypothetical protein VFE47_13600, partial [Tepidisphaeraceae bacterium]|nr:hypothetical protein [Tepidisphaeraceae bacterium]
MKMTHSKQAPRARTSYWIIWALLVALDIFAFVRMRFGHLAISKVVYSAGGSTIYIDEFRNWICPCVLLIAHVLLLMDLARPGGSFRSFLAAMVSGGTLFWTGSETGISFTSLSGSVADWQH